MYQHIVLFKLKEGVSDEQVVRLTEGIMSMAKLDCVAAINCGKNFCPRSKGYSYALTTQHNTKADLETYNGHEYHTQVKNEYIFPLVVLEETMAVDFEY